MTERISGYRDLLVWQRGVDLAEQVYLVTRSYPRQELFGLTAQSRRAAVSVPANIAEGHGRGTRAAYVNFLRIARGSPRELETHVIVARRVGMRSVDGARELLAQADEVGRMLHVLIARVADTRPST